MAAPAPEVTDVRSAREKLLSRVLSEVLPRPLQILSMRLAAGGNSRETWICEVRSGETRLSGAVRTERVWAFIQLATAAVTSGTPTVARMIHGP